MTLKKILTVCAVMLVMPLLMGCNGKKTQTLSELQQSQPVVQTGAQIESQAVYADSFKEEGGVRKYVYRTKNDMSVFVFDGRKSVSDKAHAVVFAHGDGGMPDRMMRIMEEKARDKNIICFGILRDGFDYLGYSSAGSEGWRDRYTSNRIENFNDALIEMGQLFGVSAEEGTLRGSGYSGGALILAAIMGKYHTLKEIHVDGIVGNVASWRIYDKGEDNWVKSNKNSPHLMASISPKDAKVILTVGTDDNRVPPRISKEYYRALNYYGIYSEYIEIKGAGHGLGSKKHKPKDGSAELEAALDWVTDFDDNRISPSQALGIQQEN